MAHTLAKESKNVVHCSAKQEGRSNFSIKVGLSVSGWY